MTIEDYSKLKPEYVDWETNSIYLGYVVGQSNELADFTFNLIGSIIIGTHRSIEVADGMYDIVFKTNVDGNIWNVWYTVDQANTKYTSFKNNVT
jgi:hypothetical protein